MIFMINYMLSPLSNDEMRRSMLLNALTLKLIEIAQYDEKR